ncbi:hypothetical protein Ahy_B01g055235 [Arachis hypogaea]|uniref:Transposase MuDR plant domain-containing protein n=1 Tax=Arachis hypogaea TaxID=3818 RepID=A0A445AVL7_ARAHY|nr:hypothetical protein Ahy_B01g055235 [Arachis hypogaea]
MSRNPLLSIHYDGEIVYDEEGSIVFRSEQPIITYMTPKVNSLTTLKNLILHSVGKQEAKILGGGISSADTVNDSPLSRAVRRTIRRTTVDLNMPLESSQEGPNVEVRNVDLMDDGVESLNPDDGDDADEEPPEIPDDGDEEEEMNYYGDTQIALTQPVISRPYDRPDHFTRLNLDAMTFDWSFTQGGPQEDPSNEFEVGQQFKNKKEVMLAVKQYNIRRATKYKIIESDQLSRKQEKWEVRRYTGPHTCMQTSMGQDYRRLDSKVIAQHIFTIVKADPTISIRVLQGGVENHFGYKVSYRKRVLTRIYGDWEEPYASGILPINCMMYPLVYLNKRSSVASCSSSPQTMLWN